MRFCLAVMIIALGSCARLSLFEMKSPLEGLKESELRDMFHEGRNGREHEAIDIMRPRGTPVRAVVDGNIRRLFLSKAGGNTIYQFDEDSVFCYYYAHLDRYAEGILEGKHVKRGDVIGFVGSSGNANADAPHLHFAIFELEPQKQWWKGKPLNPFPYLLAALRN
jgi:murein DD-endopeptidase MepM/ murein hydrolase activator NlpD